MTSSPLVVGVFVGGRGTRLGGVAKGLLSAPDGETTLLARLQVELAAAVPDAEIVLVGEASAYAAFGLERLADRPPGIGPLGGLLALLEHAATRGAEHALALACDLPRLERGVIARLVGAAPDTSTVVTREGDIRNPLIARYAVAAALLAARGVLSSGARSLQRVLDQLEPQLTTLPLSTTEEQSLVDWDTPEDVRSR